MLMVLYVVMECSPCCLPTGYSWLMPPSTFISTPTTYADATDARNKTASAISSGRPHRLTGTRLRRPCTSSCAVSGEGSVLKVEMTASLREFTSDETEPCGRSCVAYLHIENTTGLHSKARATPEAAWPAVHISSGGKWFHARREVCEPRAEPRSGRRGDEKTRQVSRYRHGAAARRYRKVCQRY
jgi:hypothetical protein